MQHVDGKDQAIFTPGINKDPLESYEGAEVNPNFVAGLEVGPWFGWKPAIDCPEDSFHFRSIDRSRDASGGDNRVYAGGCDEGDPQVGVETGEDVAWKKRHLDIFDAVGVTARFNASRCENLYLLMREVTGDADLRPGPDFNGIPLELGRAGYGGARKSGGAFHLFLTDISLRYPECQERCGGCRGLSKQLSLRHNCLVVAFNSRGAKIIELQAAELAVEKLSTQPRLEAAEKSRLETFHAVTLLENFQILLATAGAGCGF